MIEKLIRYRLVLGITFLTCQILWISLQLELLGSSFPEEIGWLLKGLSCLLWLLVLLDMWQAEIYNKGFWILSMCFLPFLAPALYLVQRKRLLHLRSSIFRRK